MRRVAVIGLIAALTLLGGCTSGGTAGTRASAPSSHVPAPSPPTAIPPSSTSAAAVGSGAPGDSRFRHIVVVMMENHSYRDVLDSPAAPYLRHLARIGTNYTDFHAETHPSQPNYIALFAGSSPDIDDDSCPHSTGANNLGHQLLANGDTFLGYSEDLPSVGWKGCDQGAYVRRHAPWTNFTDLPGSASVPMSQFPSDPSKLPSLAFVIPNLDHDMHDGTIAAGDAWISAHLGSYAIWARTHQGLLVVTFDEDDRSENNIIPTIAVGEGVPPRTDHTRLDHYSLLAALEDNFGLARLGNAGTAARMHLVGG